MKKSLYFFVILAILFGTGMAARPLAAGPDSSSQRAAVLSRPAQVPDLNTRPNGNPSGIHIDYGNLPLYFTANRGQVDGRALFYAKAARYTLWLTEEGLIFDTFKSERTEAPSAGKEPFLRPEKRADRGHERDVSRLVFLNAAKRPEIVPMEETALKVNYFIGNDPAKWHTAVPTSGAVLYQNIYDRIDLKVYGTEGRIEYDWIVRPGGDPRNIRFKYENVKGTRVDEAGNLLVETGFGELMHKKPEAYQGGVSKLPAEGRSSNNTRVAVESAFKKIGENAYGFEIGAYEAGLELVIDPVVLAYAYSTYLGGNNNDASSGIAVDGSGIAYVTGHTWSTDFPTLNQYQTDSGEADVFVTKIDTTKSGNASLIYSTYLGGNGFDIGYGIAVDGSGIVYIAGYTESTDLPTLNQYQTDQPGRDAFVTKIDTTKSGNASLIYSTYLGGNGDDRGYGIAADSNGNAYVVGDTFSSDFPILNQYQTDQADQDIFVTKIDTTKSGDASLVYSTYLGGSGAEIGYGIAVDSNGNAYVTGYTYSPDFPTRNQYQTDPEDADVFVTKIDVSMVAVTFDAFVTKIDTTKSGDASLVYSTYLGGSGDDKGFGIAADGSGNAYVTGYTSSSDFPTRNQYQANPTEYDFFVADYDVFVTKIDTTKIGNASLVYSTYLGGSSGDYGLGIAVDGSGNAYITGYTYSTDFPTLNQFQTYIGGGDVFATKIDTTKSGNASLVYSTYLGGNSDEIGYGIAVDGSGNAYVTGYTNSTDFPTLNQYQTDQAGYEAFITKLGFSAPVANADIAVTKTSDNLTPKVGEAFHFTVTVTNNGPGGNAETSFGPGGATGLKVADPLPAALTYQSSIASNGTYTPGTGIWDIGALANGAAVTLTITVKGTSSGLVTNTAVVSALNETDPVPANNSASAAVTVKNTYTLTVAAGAGGTTNPVPGTYTYDEGTIVSVQATAEAGYRFGGWSGDASGTTSPVSVTMNGNKTVTATFIRQYTLTVAAGAGGTTNPVPGTYTYDEGTAVGITATASAGYRFGSWSGDASGAANPVSVTMNGNKTVTAGFIRQFTLTVVAGAGGTTNPVPGTYTYDEGTAVGITATALAGYRFGNWSGDASGAANPVSVIMNGNKTVAASFVRRITLTIGAGFGGTTNPAPGTYTYDEGASVSVQANPATGYQFDSWTGDASGSANPVTVVMNGNKSIVANFSRAVKPPLSLTGEKTINRSVSMIETVARLRWQANGANPGTVGYRIYRIDNGQGTLIANVGAGTFEYIVRNLQAGKAYRFGVTAVDSQGWESDIVEVAVQ